MQLSERTAYFKNIASVGVLLCLALQAQALSPNVDLRDLIRYGSAQDRQEAKALSAQLNRAPVTFGLPDGIGYSSQPLTSIGRFAVSTIEVQNASASDCGCRRYGTFTCSKEK